MCDTSMVPLLGYQRSALDLDRRFTWNCWARQTGKTFTFSLRRISRGIARRRDQIFLSAGERQSREVMQKVRHHCHAMKVWCEVQEKSYLEGTTLQKLEARLPGGMRIIALPANPLTARGFSGDVFLDEFAMHREDAEIWAALFPTLLRGAGELDIASTPRGQGNLFYRLQENERFARSAVTLKEAVAAGLEVDIDVLRSAIHDELIWRQEFCCEFVDEATSFMPYALIRSCHDVRLDTAVDWGALERRDRDIYLGMDVGRARDLTAIWVWENVKTSRSQTLEPPRRTVQRQGRAAKTGEGVRAAMERDAGRESRGEWVREVPTYVGIEPAAGANAKTAKSQNAKTSEGLDAARRWCDAGVFVTRGVVVMQRAPFVEQEEMIARLLAQPAVRRCCVDATGIGGQLAEELVDRFGEHRVEAVNITAGLKNRLAGTLRVMAERGRLRIPVDDAIANDWHSISRTAVGGGVRLDAPRSGGSHADRFWAAALGLYAAEGDEGPVEFLSGEKLQFARGGIW